MIRPMSLRALFLVSTTVAAAGPLFAAGPAPSGRTSFAPSSSVRLRTQPPAGRRPRHGRPCGRGCCPGPVQQPEPVAAAEPPAQVIGVLIAPPVRKALLRFGDGQTAWMAEGEAAEGWEVGRVEQSGVVLKGAGGDVRLDLYEPAR